MSKTYSEDRLVQETTANYFEQTLGWESIYAFDTETYGTNSTLGRNHRREVVLLRYLRAALEKLNPGHPDIVYERAIEQLLSYSTSKTLLQINQEKYALIHEGIRVNYRTDTGEQIDPLLHVIDFDHPENNHFLVVRELWIGEPPYNRRPDIIGFVNGLPLLFIELKRSDKDIRLAYDGNYSDYKDTIPQLFHYNAIVMLSNGIDAKVGSLTSPYEFFHEWKRLSETEPGRVHFETMLQGICSKSNFIDLLDNFIVYDDSSSSTVKILARNHQYLGVNRAFQAVQDRSVRDGKLGVFWHTQGSGKSYSMAFLSEKVLRKIRNSFTVLVVTDRQELDNQIVQTFAGIKAVRDDKTQATSGEHLVELLKGNHRYIFTLIHKFNQPGICYSDRENILVICDEAHRTQYGKLAENMRLGLPKASFIAFTGTPLMASKEDQLTRNVFGDYVSTYDFQRAIDDGATVPLYYDNRGGKLVYVKDGEEKFVATPEDINKRIAEELAKLDLDEEAEEKVLRRIGGDYLVLTAEERLDLIAQDLVAHYTQRWELGKAMLICLDKITAVRMYNLIDKYWKEAIAAQNQAVRRAKDDQDRIEQTRYLTWLTETEYAVVISEAQNEIKTFQEWNLDIKPHRTKLKTRNLEEDFKNEKHPFRLAIVCAMWLTGFDVPTLSTLYMDKPMQGHSLMQAIARANRVAAGKNNGLLIDYNGILKSLRKALAKYARAEAVESGEKAEDIENRTTPYKDLEELQADYAQSIQACIEHLATLGFDLQALIDAQGFDRLALLDKENRDSAVNLICTNDESRARFEVLAREVFKKRQALVAEPHLAAPFRSQYEALEAIYNHLHEQRAIATDLNAVLRSMHAVVSSLITVEPSEQLPGADSGKLYDISKINFDLLKEEFSKSTTKNTSVQTLKDAVEQQINRMVYRNPSRINLYNRYQQIMEDYNREKDRVTIEQTFEELMELIRTMSVEDSRSVREGLSDEYLAVFDLLIKQKNDLNPKTRNQIKKIAQNLVESVKAEIRKLQNWRDKDTTQAQVKTFIYDYLYSDATGLPVDDYDESEVEDLANVVYLHMYQRYESADNTAYSEAA